MHSPFGCSNRLTQTRNPTATSKPTGDGDGDCLCSMVDGCFMVFPNIGVSQNGWFLMESPMNKWMIWGENPPFLETPKWTFSSCCPYFLSFFPLRRPADLAPAPTSPLACQVQASRQGVLFRSLNGGKILWIVENLRVPQCHPSRK